MSWQLWSWGEGTDLGKGILERFYLQLTLPLTSLWLSGKGSRLESVPEAIATDSKSIVVCGIGSIPSSVVFLFPRTFRFVFSMRFVVLCFLKFVKQVEYKGLW